MRWTIAAKLTCSIGVVSALIAGGTWFVHDQLVRMGTIEDRLVHIQFPASQAATRVYGALHSVEVELHTFAAQASEPGGAEKQRPQYERGLRELSEALDALRALAPAWNTPEGAQEVQAIIDTVERFKAKAAEVVTLATSVDAVPAVKLANSEVQPRITKMVASLTAMIDEEAADECTPEHRAVLIALANSRGSLGLAGSYVQQFMAHADPKVKAAFEDRWAANAKAFAALSAVKDTLSPSERAQFDSYAGLRTDAEAQARRAIAARERSDWNAVSSMLSGPLSELGDAIEKQALGLAAAAQTQAASDLTRLNAARSMAFVALVASGLVSILVGGSTVLLTSRRIARSLRIVVDRASEIGRGNLTGADLEVTSNDEIADLTNALNTMSGSIRGIVFEIGDASSSVAAAATQIASTSQQISGGVDAQSRQVAQVAASIEEMTASVAEVAKSAQDVSSHARKSGELADAGRQAVDKTLLDMKDISDSVVGSSKTVTELGERSEQIGKIVEVINDIAEQTNLLALNAAIEAARAGEHGRGFAVVAEEVRKLADRTTVATGEIAKSIQEIRGETALAVDQITAGTHKVAQGVERAAGTGETLSTIVASAQEVARMIQSIAAAAEQQGAAAQEISRTVVAVNTTAQETAAGSTQCSQAAAHLSERAERLDQLVNRFRSERRTHNGLPPAGVPERREAILTRP